MPTSNEHINLTPTPLGTPRPSSNDEQDEVSSALSSLSTIQGAETPDTSTGRIFFKKTAGEAMTGHTPTKKEIAAFMQERLEVMETRMTSSRTKQRGRTEPRTATPKKRRRVERSESPLYITPVTLPTAPTPSAQQDASVDNDDDDCIIVQHNQSLAVTPRKRRRAERSESPLFVTPAQSPAAPTSSAVQRNDVPHDDDEGANNDDDGNGDDGSDCVVLQHNVAINDSPCSKRAIPWTEEPKARHGHCSMQDCKEVRGPTIQCSGGCHRKAHAKCIAARTIVGRNNHWTCKTCRSRAAREKAKGV